MQGHEVTVTHGYGRTIRLDIEPETGIAETSSPGCDGVIASSTTGAKAVASLEENKWAQSLSREEFDALGPRDTARYIRAFQREVGISDEDINLIENHDYDGRSLREATLSELVEVIGKRGTARRLSRYLSFLGKQENETRLSNREGVKKIFRHVSGSPYDAVDSNLYDPGWYETEQSLNSRSLSEDSKDFTNKELQSTEILEIISDQDENSSLVDTAEEQACVSLIPKDARSEESKEKRKEGTGNVFGNIVPILKRQSSQPNVDLDRKMSEIDDENGKVDVNTDWQENTQWADAFRKAITSNKGLSMDAQVAKSLALAELSLRMLQTVEKHGKEIIDNIIAKHGLDNNSSSSRVNIGGVAGGVKFIKNGILFKLAADPKISSSRYLYGGKEPSFHRAAKAASQELKGNNSYTEHFLEQAQPVILPQQMLIDYRGYRFVAMSVLPLKHATLIHGSDDAGDTIVNSDEKFREWMEEAGEALHLAEHKVRGKYDVHPSILCTGGDVEGHRLGEGEDSSYYLLDLARWAPCESPLDTPHLPSVGSSIFFRMLRPEFLTGLKQSGSIPRLSSDTFSGWGRWQCRSHRENLRNATKLMCGSVVEKVVIDILHEVEQFQLHDTFDISKTRFPADVGRFFELCHPDDLDLTQIFHARGLPMRHMKLVHEGLVSVTHRRLSRINGEIDRMVSSAKEQGSLVSRLMNLHKLEAEKLLTLKGHLGVSRVAADALSRALKRVLREDVLRGQRIEQEHSGATGRKGFEGENEQSLQVAMTEFLNSLVGSSTDQEVVEIFWKRTLRCSINSFGFSSFSFDGGERGALTREFTKEYYERGSKNPEREFIHSHTRESEFLDKIFEVKGDLKIDLLVSIRRAVRDKEEEDMIWLPYLWKSRLARFAHPPVFALRQMFETTDPNDSRQIGYVNATQKFHIDHIRSRSLEHLPPIQQCARRHLPLVIRLVFAAAGIRLPSQARLKLLTWYWTDNSPKLTPLELKSRKGNSLLQLRCKSMNVVRNALFCYAIHCMCQELKKPLDKWEGCWKSICETRGLLESADEQLQGIITSGGSGNNANAKVLHGLLQILRSMRNFKTTPWRQGNSRSNDQRRKQLFPFLLKVSEVLHRQLLPHGPVGACVEQLLLLVKNGIRELIRQNKIEQTVKGATFGNVPVYIPTELRRIKKVGRGNFGIVWHVEIVDKKQTAVLKVTDAKSVAVHSELQVMLCFEKKHPNLLGLIGITTINKQICLLTSYCEMGSLDLLHRTFDLKSIFPFIVHDTASGIAELHRQNILHRDIACRNLLVTSEWRIVLGDFGLSKKMEHGSKIYIPQSRLQIAWAWASPESLKDSHFTFQSDIWSFGVTMWEILCNGRRPYDEQSKKYTDAKLKAQIGNGLLHLNFPGELKLDCVNGHSKRQAESCIRLAKSCLEVDATRRPSAMKIINMIETEFPLLTGPEEKMVSARSPLSRSPPSINDTSNVGSLYSRVEGADIRSVKVDADAKEEDYNAQPLYLYQNVADADIYSSA